MSMRINEWTRTHDDKCRYDYERNMSERPLRYMTNNVQSRPDDMDTGNFTKSTHVSANNIQTANDLRPKMTNLNEISSLQTAQFATVPFMGSGELLSNNGYIDINSDLRGNATRLYEEAGKVQVQNYTPGFLQDDPQNGAILPNNWIVGGRSSRNDMRELYKEMC